jgi:ATP-dependent protease ClpP protease subunit
MANVKAHELENALNRVVLKRLRSLKVPRPLIVAEELASLLMDEIPSEAYHPKESWEQGHLFFHGDVERGHVLDVQETLLQSHLNLKSDIPITLYLSSFGGCVMTGLALASTIQEIRRTGRAVNVHIQGCAMSMGSLIAQVCDLRTIEPQSWFMIHEIAMDIPHSKTSIVRDEADFLERLEQQTFSLYAARTGKPIEYWRKKMHRRDWFLTAAEALEEGLVDEVKPVPAYPKFRRRRAVSEA